MAIEKIESQLDITTALSECYDMCKLTVDREKKDCETFKKSELILKWLFQAFTLVIQHHVNGSSEANADKEKWIKEKKELLDLD